MKKLFCLVLALLIYAASACAETDLSNLGADELISLREAVNAEINARALYDDSMILFEDESIAIQYDGLRVETHGDNAYLIISFVLNNKTNENLNMRYDSIVINGCTVDLSKRMEVPADSVKIDELTTDGEVYLRYNIETVETVRLLFTDENSNHFTSETIAIENE